MKMVDPDVAEFVRLQPTPSLAAKEGRRRTYRIHPNWDDIKNDVMRKAIHAKFSQHPNLATKLISTGDAILIEHTDRDSYWADGGYPWTLSGSNKG
jgi:ribA/ribD-fused uncharacterized protein